ncbi:MAG: glycosyltransferase [Clostridia bacterium]|nr:glycosyltransferase [Clostridia bacterium]
MPSISIIIPVYNVEEYIRECLDSLLKQTIRDELEVIIVNDGSTDNSQKIIDEYVKKYPKLFKCYIKKNEGQGIARNYGVKYATGEYIGFVDGDDYIKFDMYEILYKEAKEKKLDIVVCDMLWVYADKTTQSRSTLPKFIKEFNYYTYILSNPGPVNKIYKREIWNKEKIQFPDIWYEDLGVIPAMVKYTENIGYVNKELYLYRQRQNSTMLKTEYNEKLLDIIKACNNLYDILKDTKFLQELEYLYIFQLIYFSSFRFLKFNKYKDIEKCVKEVKIKFPDWKKNKYYKTKPFLFKLFCNLICKKQYLIVKLLVKIGRGN